MDASRAQFGAGSVHSSASLDEPAAQAIALA
jgi:hypothetical protein